MNPIDLAQIKEYLKGNLSVDTGIALLFKYSRKSTLVRNVMSRPTSKQLKQHMDYELKKILKQHGKTQSKITSNEVPQHDKAPESRSITKVRKLPVEKVFSPIPCNVHLPNDHSGDSNNAPNQFVSIVDRILQERKEAYRLRGHLHGRLHEARSNEDRHEIVLKLYAVQKTLNSLERDLKRAEQGKTPNRFLKRDESVSTFIRLRNLKTYLSRYQKKLDAATTTKDRNKFTKKIESLKQEIDKINGSN